MSSFPTASGNDEHLGELRRRPAPANPRLPAAAGELPRLAVRPRRASPRPRRSGKLRELPEPAQAEPFELRVAVGWHGEQRQRERLEELLLLRLRNEHDLTRASDARRGQCGEAAPGRADARIPARAGGRERPLERRPHAPVQPLDAARLEDDDAVLDGVDGEAGVLEAAQHSLPLPLDGRRVAVDERERRARGERLPQAHPRLDACGLGGGGHRAEQRLLPRSRSERRRLEREPRPRAQRRSQLEPGNEETGDHRNICSIRTCVLLSSYGRDKTRTERNRDSHRHA